MAKRIVTSTGEYEQAGSATGAVPRGADLLLRRHPPRWRPPSTPARRPNFLHLMDNVRYPSNVDRGAGPAFPGDRTPRPGDRRLRVRSRRRCPGHRSRRCSEAPTAPKCPAGRLGPGAVRRRADHASRRGTVRRRSQDHHDRSVTVTNMRCLSWSRWSRDGRSAAASRRPSCRASARSSPSRPALESARGTDRGGRDAAESRAHRRRAEFLVVRCFPRRPATSPRDDHRRSTERR